MCHYAAIASGMHFLPQRPLSLYGAENLDSSFIEEHGEHIQNMVFRAALTRPLNTAAPKVPLLKGSRLWSSIGFTLRGFRVSGFMGRGGLLTLVQVDCLSLRRCGLAFSVLEFRFSFWTTSCKHSDLGMKGVDIKPRAINACLLHIDLSFCVSRLTCCDLKDDAK